MTTPADSAHTFRYAAHGGIPLVDLSVEVAADGSFVLDVLTQASLAQQPPTRLGRFAGRLAPALAARLARWAATVPAPPPGHGDAPDTVSRLVASGSAPLRPVAGGGDELAELEAELSDAFIAALAQPVAAIEALARRDARARGGGYLAIRSVGREPFLLLLFARDIAGYWARVWRDEPGVAGGRLDVSHETIVALAAVGTIAEGPTPLAPGDTVELPLPEPSLGTGTPATGGFIVWRAGTGPERRLVSGTWQLPPGASTP